MPDTQNCLITNWPFDLNISEPPSTYGYLITISGVQRTIIIATDDVFKISDYPQERKRILKGLLLNEIWHQERFTTVEVLDALIESNKSTIPSTPKDKKDKLLNSLYKRLNYDGEVINLNIKEVSHEAFWLSLFLKNKKELLFYAQLLKEENLANIKYFVNNGEYDTISSFSLTAKGIEYILKLNEGDYSSNCFVAMAFDSDMNQIYDNAIKPAVEATRFKPIRIDREHISSDTTINDSIIASIKKARFTIADFTSNRNGVYFEAGFALGRGQKVIYTCKESDLANLHFDIRAYQQIVWRDAADFKQKLIDKIEAFIK